MSRPRGLGAATKEAEMADETPDAEAPETGDQAPDNKSDIPPEVKAALRKANKEAETLRHKLKEIEDAEKSELQKLQDAIGERDTQLAELPKAIRSQAIRFASTATQMGFVDPEDALVLVGDVDLADGAAVKAALEDLAQRKPHLVRTDPAPRVPTRPRPVDGQPAAGGSRDNTTGKRRAAEALRTLAVN
jgi:hypothetical protein